MTRLSKKIILSMVGVFLFFAAATLPGASAQGDSLLNALSEEVEKPAENSQAPASTSRIFSDLLGNTDDAPRIDVIEVKNMEVAEVLNMISRKSGLTIIAGDEIRGRVTIFLKDIDARDALKIILDATDLAYVERNGIVRVITADEFERREGVRFGANFKTKAMRIFHTRPDNLLDILNQMKSPTGKIIFNDQDNTLVLMDTPQILESMTLLVRELDVPIETEIFELKYVKAQDIAEEVEPVLTKKIGRLQFDNRANSLVVTDTHLKVTKIKQLIEKLDKKQKNIVIESKIIQIILNDEHPRGVDWEAIVADYQSIEFQGFAYNQEISDTGFLSLGTISDEDYTILLDALDTVGIISTISNYKLPIEANQESEITVKSKDVYLDPADAGQEDNKDEEDVKIYIKPKIDLEEKLTIQIRPQAQTNDYIEQYLKKQVNVAVEPGETIVVGSLFKDVTVESMRKIPLLGDLPLLGFVFRNPDQSMRKAEIIMFLTPRIIVSDEKL